MNIQKTKLIFRYLKNNKEYNKEFLELNSEIKDDDFIIEADYQNDNILKVNIIPLALLKIVELKLVSEEKFEEDDVVFLNGYQTWTDSRELTKNDKMKGINHIPNFIKNKYNFQGYGDYTFVEYSNKKGCFHGFSYGYIRNKDRYRLIGSVSEKNGFTIIKVNMNENQLIIEKDCKGLEIKEKYEAFEIFHQDGNEDKVFDEYFECMNIVPRKAEPIVGYTSWYNYYQNISEDILLKDLNSMDSIREKVQVFQIDDGYQEYVGDWLKINKNKFPNGLKVITDNIKEKGLIPGIWMAPFVCEKNSKIYKTKKDWILKDEKNNEFNCGSNWSGFVSLDIYNEEVRSYIRECINVMKNEYGFTLFKMDFLYGACTLPRKDKTRGQIMQDAMKFLRDCVGDGMILACGVPLFSCFGLVEYARVGCDISLDIDDKWFMKFMHRERTSTRRNMINTIYRRQLNNRAFLNDPDVFLLRKNNIKLTQKQKEDLLFVNSMFGRVLFTSDNITSYDQKELTLFFKALLNMKKEILDVKEIKKNIFEIQYQENDNSNNMNVSSEDDNDTFINKRIIDLN